MDQDEIKELLEMLKNAYDDKNWDEIENIMYYLKDFIDNDVDNEEE
jgi:hypothetical protein